MTYVLRLSRCFLLSILIPAAMLTAQTTHDSSTLVQNSIFSELSD